MNVWTVTITEKLKRILLPSSDNQQAKTDFVITRFNTPCTVNPVQYYVDGDGVEEYEASIQQLCYELADKTGDEYGIIHYAKKFTKHNAGHHH